MQYREITLLWCKEKRPLNRSPDIGVRWIKLVSISKRMFAFKSPSNTGFTDPAFWFPKDATQFLWGHQSKNRSKLLPTIRKIKKNETKADVKPNTKKAQVLFTSKLVKKVQALFNYHCYASDKGTGMLRVILNCLMFARFTQKCHVADLVQLCKSTRIVLGTWVFKKHTEIRTTLKFKVALNPMYNIFWTFVKSCVSSCLSKFDNIKKKFHRDVFEL